MLIYEEGVVRVAKKAGFNVVVAKPEMMKRAEQFAGFVNHGKVLMGVHGPRLTNMVFLSSEGSNADIMKVGGYKLSALEIEAVLLEHPVVSECCVLGLQDKDYGEIVCAIIVTTESKKKVVDQEFKPAISLEELQKWSKERLAPYKIPTKLLLWDDLPRNAMGKVNKKELKRLLEN